MKEPQKTYNPAEIEEKWYCLWDRSGYFSPDALQGEPYSIVIPPPNVTGSLHMGHALNTTLQDILVRWRRMQGRKALWIPGTDHAGIATQNVVEREFAREGLDRHRLGREAFIRRVWKWKAEYGGRIIHQLKKLGASCDWGRERFTLDEGLSTAVKEVFVRLYEKGLIYRDKRLINWCPRCHTALSDLEVEHEELDGLLTYIRYPFPDGKGYLTVATTRPETMLGDTAVAVNPGDERYGNCVVMMVNLPLTGRQIPVISDIEVDPSFGTGVVKITPAHDFNDEAIAKRQRPPLPSFAVIDENGRMSAEAGSRYAGLDRYECRKRVVLDLKELNLIEKEERYRHSVGHCYRCKTVIEPLSTPQWYVRVKPLASQAIAAVREGRIRIIPSSWENTYFSWMENIKDWCISRQIWWGHRIPVWYCDACGEMIVSRDAPRSCSCGGATLRQEEDVLDTWFSSALWPFSTLGWPDDTEDLRTYYPTSVLVTGFDILFFWVARMIMMGLEFMSDVPFRDVYIHALVRDSKGQKMSKSKGNVIDPLIMVAKYGADAFRFSLAAFAAQGRDIRFAEERVEGYRHFVNKLWNASRFIMMNVDAAEGMPVPSAVRDKGRSADLAGRWVLSRLAAAVEEVNAALEEYRFNDAAHAVYRFIWHEFCDWYIEMSKHSLYKEKGNKSETISILFFVLDVSLRLLHPFMPFVTEEIRQQTRKYMHESGESIVIAPYPLSLPGDIEAEREISPLIEAVVSIRNIRGEMNIPPSSAVKVLIRTLSGSAERTLKENLHYIELLAKARDIEIGMDVEKPGNSATAVRELFEVYLPMEGLLDIEAEVERLTRETKKVQESLGFIGRKLSSEDFLSRAPREVVEKERARHSDLVQRYERLNISLQKLREMG
jgi:valyl-tRNA synthetase